MALGQNIRRQRKMRGWTLEQLAAHSGVDVGTISALENRDSERSKYAAPIAQALGVSLESLSGGAVEPAPLVVKDDDAVYASVRTVKLRVSAGIAGFAVDVDEMPGQPIFFRRDWLRLRGFNPAKLHAIKVRGRSMEPTLYAEDMIVFNEADTTPRDGDVFVINFAGEVVVKRLIKEGPVWWMHSDNTDQQRYPRVRCDEHCLLLGRVVHRQSETI
jgi:helix-turn-helix motif:peptidase S24, S26A and S26B